LNNTKQKNSLFYPQITNFVDKMNTRLICQILFATIFNFSFLSLKSQQVVLSGTLTDSKTGEALVGAYVYFTQLETGGTSNNYGYYSISVKPGQYEVRFSYVGFESKIDTILLNTSVEYSVQLDPVVTLSNVVVTDDPSREKLNNASTGRIDIPVEQIKLIPAILGETDVIKALQLLPGVSGGTEASSGMYVRGGGNDQNLILLDGVPLYNVTHMFGFFSLFNPQAINSVNLYKGGFPARYGGRLSSVIDITMKDGNKKEIEGFASLGIISGNVSLNGPLDKAGKTTFSVSARRTVLDLLFNAFTDGTEDLRPVFYFYDLNAKIVHKINERDKLFFSFYNGKDEYGARYAESSNNSGVQTSAIGRAGLKWGNTLGSVKWSRINNKRLFSHYTANVTRFGFQIYDQSEYKQSTQSGTSQMDFNLKYLSGIVDVGLKADYEYNLSKSHFLRFGAQTTSHLFTPGRLSISMNQPGISNFDTTLGLGGMTSYENAIYLETDHRVSKNMKLNYGMRLVSYHVENTTSFHPEPRFALNYNFNNEFSANIAYTRMNQFVHLIANSSTALPADLWVPATANLRPMSADQFSLGIFKPIASGFDFTIEGYYKYLNKVLDYKEGVSFFNLGESWDDRVAAGEGWSYGVEMFIQKTSGRLKGWLGGTWSKSDRLIPEVNFGQLYPFKYDRRWDFSLTLTYEVNERVALSTNFVYTTGSAITFPVGKYPDINGKTVYEYGSKNGYRMPDYQRVDIGLTKKHKKVRTHGIKKQGYNLSIYNVLARNNPFFLYLDESQVGMPPRVIQVSIFNFIPGFSYYVYF
jgi:hypothetical protein